MYYKNEQGIEHSKKIHSLYERYVVGKRYGNPYISVIPIYEHKDNPLVSVIMPVYNGGKYIASAVECVLIQNYRNFELIIIDDGSKDNTKLIIEGFKDEKIRYFGKKNEGPAAARNVGIKNSQGQFVVLLDADDMMTPDFISGHLQEFEKRPDADLIYCDDCLIDEKDKPIRVISRPEYKDSRKVIQDLFSSGFPVVPFRTCIRKEVFEKIGLYDEELLVAEDYDMIRRFVKQQLKLYHLPRALYLRRLTSGGLSRSFSEEKARSHFEVVRRIAETFEYDELFPGVKWEKIAPENRQMHLRCLVAATLLGIGQSYKLANSPGYALMAIDLARKEIKECIKAEPENQVLQQLINRCRLYESELAVKSAEGRQKAYQPA